MSRIATYDELLTVCIQDLHHGEAMLADALPKIAEAANDPVLRALFDRVAADAATAADLLAETGRHAGGSRNLWMSGILDDARRDTRATAAGPLLDTALVGAIRKAKAAQIVSYDTAVAVAAVLDQGAVRRTLENIRRHAAALDRSLSGQLPRTG